MIDKEKIPEEIGIKLNQLIEDHKKAKFDTIAAFAFSSEKELGTQIMLASHTDYLLMVCIDKMLNCFFDKVSDSAKQAYMYWFQNRINEIKEKYNLE
jgi:hypothetical protein